MSDFGSMVSHLGDTCSHCECWAPANSPWSRTDMRPQSGLLVLSPSTRAWAAHSKAQARAQACASLGRGRWIVSRLLFSLLSVGFFASVAPAQTALHLSSKSSITGEPAEAGERGREEKIGVQGRVLIGEESGGSCCGCAYGSLPAEFSTFEWNLAAGGRGLPVTLYYPAAAPVENVTYDARAKSLARAACRVREHCVPQGPPEPVTRAIAGHRGWGTRCRGGGRHGLVPHDLRANRR